MGLPGRKANFFESQKIRSNTAKSYNSLNPSDPVVGMYKQSLILDVLTKQKGRLVQSAKQLKISLKTLQGYIQKSKTLQECLISFNEEELDNAEEKLQKQIEKENLSAIQFYLKCKGKDRGWTEKSEMSIEMVKPITFKYTVVKAKE